MREEIPPTKRPEDGVACPACGKSPGDSCDGPTSHPSRVTAYANRPWVINNIQSVNCCGFCGKSFDLEKGHTCSKAAISRGGKTFLTAVDAPAPATSCPSCKSTGRDLRFGTVVRIMMPLNGEAPTPSWCNDAWHNVEPPAAIVHRPRIARTLMSGPGNRILVRGCSCGAETMSAKAFATHVGISVDTLQAMLDLYGIVSDLLDYPNDPRMQREPVMHDVLSYFDFKPAPSGETP